MEKARVYLAAHFINFSTCAKHSIRIQLSSPAIINPEEEPRVAFLHEKTTALPNIIARALAYTRFKRRSLEQGDEGIWVPTISTLATDSSG